MKIRVVQTRSFRKDITYLISKHKLLQKDFDAFEEFIAANPEFGDTIPGASGLRKIRIKGASKGKSGGFRVCYYYVLNAKIYLIVIYGKNEIEDISAQDKKKFKEVIEQIKKGNYE